MFKVTILIISLFFSSSFISYPFWVLLLLLVAKWCNFLIFFFVILFRQSTTFEDMWSPPRPIGFTYFFTLFLRKQLLYKSVGFDIFELICIHKQISIWRGSIITWPELLRQHFGFAAVWCIEQMHTQRRLFCVQFPYHFNTYLHLIYAPRIWSV